VKIRSRSGVWLGPAHYRMKGLVLKGNHDRTRIDAQQRIQKRDRPPDPESSFAIEGKRFPSRQDYVKSRAKTSLPWRTLRRRLVVGNLPIGGSGIRNSVKG